MISEETLKIEWLQEIAKTQRIKDTHRLEKTIRALLLLEGLAEAEIPFIFKGGTALMLMLGSTKRLSIDIDVVMPDEFELDDVIETIRASKGFLRVVRYDRAASSTIVKRHYKFYYVPLTKGSVAEEPVLLDVVFEQSGYSEILQIEIDSPILKQLGSPRMVPVPSIEDLSADKLTAFAPNTTGIPYKSTEEDGREMEIIKQLFDIGTLFDRAEKVDTLVRTFNHVGTMQMSYRGRKELPSEILDDIIATAECLSTRGEAGSGDYPALLKGIKSIKPIIFSESYYLDKAIRDGAKAAYVASIIRSGKTKIERYDAPDQIRDMVLTDSVSNKLNKLKRSSPEAYYYWCKTSENL